MNKVTFSENAILVNNVTVGYFTGTRSEVWIDLLTSNNERGFAGRFKYNNPKQTAKRYIKWCLERFSTDEIVAGCESYSPYGWAMSKGYDPLTPAQREEIKGWLVPRD